MVDIHFGIIIRRMDEAPLSRISLIFRYRSGRLVIKYFAFFLCNHMWQFTDLSLLFIKLSVFLQDALEVAVGKVRWNFHCYC